MTEPTQSPNLSKLGLEQLDKIVDNSSEKNRNFFIAYLGLMIYVQAIIFSTSDLQLLLPSQQLKLPLIGLDVPLVGFYFTIPLFVIALHFNFLQNLESHHYKLMRWQQAQPGGVVPRSRVFPFLFDFAILETQSGYRNLVLWANNILCYNLAPLTLALLLFRFADRQDFPVTFWHYVCFVADCYLVWRLRKALMQNAKPEEPSRIWLEDSPLTNPHRHTRHSRWVSALLRIGGILFKPFFRLWRFVVHVSEFMLDAFRYRPHGLIGLMVLAEVLISYAIAETDDASFNRFVLPAAQSWARKDSRPVEWLLPRITIDPHATVWQADDKSLKIEAELAGETDWAKYFNTHGKGFWPDPESLRLVDLTGQNLPRAQLQDFRLQGAELGEARLQGADLGFAELQGAVLRGAQLQGADLGGAELQGAVLGEARLQGAELRGARLQGAYLYRTQLQGAYLYRAQLQGADLHEAQLQGADLRKAQLQGADLREAQLQGAILASTAMDGLVIGHAMPVFATDPTQLFNDKTNWGGLEKRADEIPEESTRQEYLERIKAAQHPDQLHQARPFLRFQPQAIAPAAVAAICTAKSPYELLPKESRSSSALAFRNRYLKLADEMKKNPDYPKLLQDIDYQLCTLPECQDIRGDIKGLYCAKSKPPEW